MPRNLCRRVVLATLATALCAPAVLSQNIATTRIASGLSRPLYVGSPKGDVDRLFVIEQWEARIRIIKNGTLLATPFLDLPTTKVVNSGNERGMLGLAFDPGYATNGFFYLNYNNPSGHTVIARYTRSSTNPDIADPNSERIYLMTAGVTTYSFSQPFSNHNGGWMDFGPDGYLYISTGDGGSGNDPQGNGQNLNTLLGKMLRIDVNDANNPSAPFYSSPTTNPFYGAIAGRDEIWAYGLRNPWRCSFDRLTGELYIGDVGQNAREEIDWSPPAGQPGSVGRNYGWNCREGIANLAGCTPPNYSGPIYDYAQFTSPINGFCVTGGYVYRGCAIPGLEGTYFFGDYGSSFLGSFRNNAGVVTAFTNRTSQLATSVNGFSVSTPASFGEDALGELYIIDHGGGEIFKIIAGTGVNPATATLGGTPTIGTTVNVNLSSPADPNRSYVFALSQAVWPPIVLPELRAIPLAIDPLLLFTIDPACPLLSNHYGTLSATGTATVQLFLPGDPGLIGFRAYGAFVTAVATAPSGINRISCPVTITVQ